MDYIEILNSKLLEKSMRNEAYSLRAFSRDLNINPGTLSSILKSTRRLNKEKAIDICSRLELSLDEKKAFLKSVEISNLNISNISSISKPKNKKRYFLDCDHENLYSKIIIEWEYYAILNLIEVNKYRFDNIAEISKNIDIEASRILEIIKDLFKVSFIIENDFGIIERVIDPLETKKYKSDEIIKKAHLNILKLSSDKLELPKDDREFQALTFKGNRNNTDKAKKLIHEFMIKLTEFLESSSEINDEVFQVNIQYFPLTKSENS